MLNRTSLLLSLDNDRDIEDWNSRRLKFNLEQHGSLKLERLRETEEDRLLLPTSPLERNLNTLTDFSFPLSPIPEGDFQRQRSIASINSRHSTLVSIDNQEITASYKTKRPSNLKLERMPLPSDSSGPNSPASCNLWTGYQSPFSPHESEYCETVEYEIRPRPRTTTNHISQRPLWKILSLFSKPKKISRRTEELYKLLDSESFEYYPYFTYWLSMVQVLVLITATVIHGIAPVWVPFKTSAQVQMPSRAIESVCHNNYGNLFIGPSMKALILMGARYPPCMRTDLPLARKVRQEKVLEMNEIGCCNRLDNGGCYQSREKSCSKFLASWTNETDSLCARDSCQLSGRPCCYGRTLSCIITTQAHCDFIEGTYHAEAKFCSEVNCLQDICGMIPFREARKPDQSYRLFTSQLLNPGYIQLFINLYIYLIHLRNIEKFLGPVRVFLIYFGSGTMANLFSGLLLPYKVQAGSSPNNFAILASLIVELMASWRILNSPVCNLMIYLVLLVLFLVVGLLPWIDNYANIMGLISGLILTSILHPLIGFGGLSRSSHERKPKVTRQFSFDPDKVDLYFKKTYKQIIRGRIFVIMFGTTLTLCLFIVLLALFFVGSVELKCNWCKYLTCFLLLPELCKDFVQGEPRIETEPDVCL